MRVSIIGSGYVGLVTGACLAEKGVHVVCVDKDAERVRVINEGGTPLHEKGLAELIRRNAGDRLKATGDLEQAVLESDVSIIAVGTPSDANGIDLSQIAACARQIGGALRDKAGYHVVAVKSTVVPGTTGGVVAPLLTEWSGKLAGKEFGVVMNPEFLREGQAVADFMQPDRIVIGAGDAKASECMEAVYSVFEKADVVRTSIKTAEMIKYTSNSLLATMISFANEIGNLCEAVADVDTVDVMKGVLLDRRLSPILDDGTRIVPGFASYLATGCGFGGSCFPKDVRALAAHGRDRGLPMDLLEAVLRINARQPQRILSRVQRAVAELHDYRVTVLGLAFKPDTDDMRDSPAIPVVRGLAQNGGRVRVYDPVASQRAREVFADVEVEYSSSLDDAVQDSAAIVVMTGWSEFQRLPDLLRPLMPAPLVIDGRRMFTPQQFDRYEGVGLELA